MTNRREPGIYSSDNVNSFCALNQEGPFHVSHPVVRFLSPRSFTLVVRLVYVLLHSRETELQLYAGLQTKSPYL